MKRLVFQTLITIGIFNSFVALGANIKRDIEKSSSDCYYFSFMKGNVQVNFDPQRSVPKLELKIESSSNASSEEDIPVLETRGLENNCILTSWKSNLDIKNSRGLAELKITLPQRTKEFQIVNLKGSIRGQGGSPATRAFINVDQGNIFWNESNMELLDIKQTSGSITLLNLKSSFRIKSEKTNLKIRNFQAPEESIESRIQVKHGKLTIENVKGPLSIRTKTASVIAQRTHNPLKIHTDTGSIKVKKLEAAVVLASNSGDIQSHWHSTIKGTSHITSTSGKIKLLLSPKIDAAVEVDHLSLPVESEIEGKKKGSKKVFGLNAQTHKIFAGSPDGSITIKKF